MALSTPPRSGTSPESNEVKEPRQISYHTPPRSSLRDLKEPRHRLDPNPPENPYVVGFQMELRRHNAPAPLGRQYGNYRPREPWNSADMTQLEFCLACPPLQGAVLEESASFSVKSVLALNEWGVRKGAQILQVDVDLVAKVYDPLFYDAGDVGWGRNVTNEADEDYTRETAAYSELQPYWGNLVPRYYGSWTCEVSTPTPSGPVVRPVRMILLEYIAGPRILDIEPSQLSEDQRTNVMRKIIYAESILSTYSGVDQADEAPRNFMCAGHDFDDQKLRVVLLDFNNSTVKRWMLPPNPVDSWMGLASDFSELGWLPDDHGDRRAWLMDRFAYDPNYQLALGAISPNAYVPPDLSFEGATDTFEGATDTFEGATDTFEGATDTSASHITQ